MCYVLFKSQCHWRLSMCSQQFGATHIKNELKLPSWIDFGPLNSWMSCRAMAWYEGAKSNTLYMLARFQWRCFTLCTRMTNTERRDAEGTTKNARFGFNSISFFFYSCSFFFVVVAVFSAAFDQLFCANMANMFVGLL